MYHFNYGFELAGNASKQIGENYSVLATGKDNSFILIIQSSVPPLELEFKIDEIIYKSDKHGKVSEWLPFDKEGNEKESAICYETESGEKLEVEMDLGIVKTLKEKAGNSVQCKEKTKKDSDCQNKTLSPPFCWRHRN